uniref:Uncharacterized protein n=1 Tax=Methylocapsa acidiphila TaxID=133552 RepID=Q2VNG6_METAI|nr:hypothetical protein orf138 [Methylocapsa acidiphila]
MVYCAAVRHCHLRRNKVFRQNKCLLIFHGGRGDVMRLNSRRSHCGKDQGQRGAVASLRIHASEGQTIAGRRLLANSLHRELDRIDSARRRRGPLAGADAAVWVFGPLYGQGCLRNKPQRHRGQRANSGRNNLTTLHGVLPLASK